MAWSRGYSNLGRPPPLLDTPRAPSSYITLKCYPVLYVPSIIRWSDVLSLLAAPILILTGTSHQIDTDSHRSFTPNLNLRDNTFTFHLHHCGTSSPSPLTISRTPFWVISQLHLFFSLNLATTEVSDLLENLLDHYRRLRPINQTWFTSSCLGADLTVGVHHCSLSLCFFRCQSPLITFSVSNLEENLNMNKFWPIS